MAKNAFSGPYNAATSSTGCLVPEFIRVLARVPAGYTITICAFFDLYKYNAGSYYCYVHSTYIDEEVLLETFTRTNLIYVPTQFWHSVFRLEDLQWQAHIQK